MCVAFQRQTTTKNIAHHSIVCIQMEHCFEKKTFGFYKSTITKTSQKLRFLSPVFITWNIFWTWEIVNFSQRKFSISFHINNYLVWYNYFCLIDENIRIEFTDKINTIFKNINFSHFSLLEIQSFEIDYQNVDQNAREVTALLGWLMTASISE